MFCSFVYPDLFLKRKLKPRGPPEAQPEAFQQQAPHLGWERGGITWNRAGALPSPALPRGVPAFIPPVLPKPWAVFTTVCFHVLKE